MLLARLSSLILRGLGAQLCAAALTVATSFAGRPQLNEAPPAPERTVARKSAAAQAPAAEAAAPSGFLIDPDSREMSRIFFRTVYAASENVPIGWNGNVATGNAGTTSAAFKEAVQRRVNYFRAMAGIPAGITFDATFSAKDQKAALMMSANNALSHNPPNNWTHYSADGAEAAGKSNIFLGVFGPAAITGYIEDFGSPNAAVGHRRWILYPQTKTMGTGDIPLTEDYESANALWVVTDDFGTARPGVRDEFVAWPPPGYVPCSLVYPRWSFSYPGADFTNATVTMQRGGSNVPVTIQTRGPGAGEASLVWVWDGLNANEPAEPGTPPASDTPVQVAVNGVLIGGDPRNFSYTVTLFDPEKTGADTVLATASGPAQPAVNASAPYTSNAVPGASGYQFRTAALSALTAIEGAESGMANVTVTAPSSGALVSSAYHATGAKSFRFTTPEFDFSAITLKRTVLASAATELKFKSRFGYATSDQVAHAQVSTDEGVSWHTLFTEAGTGSPAAGFAAKTVSLSAYANRAVKVRFIFAYEGFGTAYTDPAENIGWYLDDVSFANAQEFISPVLGAVSAGTSHNFTPAAAGHYAVQARGQFFGDYLFEWGPVLVVEAVANEKPKITTHPANRTIAAGGNVQFSVVATGAASYQWFHGDNPLPGATSAALALTGVTPDDAGSYRVDVTNAFGTTPSNAAALTVTVPNPVTTTLAGSALSETAVQLSGHVEVNAQTVTCGFEYGPTASLGSVAAAGTASAPKDFNATISNLAANAIVYYRAYAENTGGTRFRGAVKSVAVLKPVAALTVTASPAGGGSVSGAPAMVRVGDKVTLTAQAAAGFAFTGWTGGLTKTTATISFTMPATLALTANFSSSPIIRAAGKYRGLVLTNPVAHASCGIVNLTIGAKGSFSGTAVIGGTKFGLRGVFDADGVAHFGAATEATLKRGTQPPLLLRLNLPTGNVSPTRVFGDVREAGGFTATIDAPRIYYTAAKTPIAPLLNPPGGWLGVYTADLTASPNAPIADLAGFGWITATVAKDGSVRFTGALPDGTRWTSTQTLIANGTVPIYVALHGGKGSLFGTVQLSGTPVMMAAKADWYRPPNLPGTRFLAGWPGGITVSIAGGAWTPFKANVSWPLPGLAATTGFAGLAASGGGLSPSLDWSVTFNLKTGTAVVSPTPSGATASFKSTAGTGIFTGSFKTSPAAAAIGFSGALLPGANRARGYFLTPTGSGSIVLQPQ